MLKLKNNSMVNLYHLLSQKKHRSYLDIIASILEAIKDKKMSIFPILKLTRTNYVQLKRYLEYLIDIGLVEIYVENRRVLYKASNKGLAFLEHYNILQQMLLGKRSKRDILIEAYIVRG